MKEILFTLLQILFLFNYIVLNFLVSIDVANGGFTECELNLKYRI